MVTRRRIIAAVDWVHAHVFRHRPYRMCDWLAMHPWWGKTLWSDDALTAAACFCPPDPDAPPITEPRPTWVNGTLDYLRVPPAE